MEQELSWESRKYYLSKVPHRSQVMFALFCAKQVRHLSKDNAEAEKCIEVVERWLKGKATAEECYVAGAAAYATDVTYAEAATYAADAAADAADAAAYTAAYTADAAYAAAYTDAAAYAATNTAYAAAYATYAAYAAAAATAATAYAAVYDAASAAAYAAAADAAAYAAADAAAAAYAAKEAVKKQQVEYLRSLYLDSLPENERNCWLVQACL